MRVVKPHSVMQPRLSLRNQTRQWGQRAVRLLVCATAWLSPVVLIGADLPAAPHPQPLSPEYRGEGSQKDGARPTAAPAATAAAAPPPSQTLPETAASVSSSSVPGSAGSGSAGSAGAGSAGAEATSASSDARPRPDPDSRGRASAVALNYCRASFHRLRRYQSKRVLFEEQEKILNNLNLNGIGDEEVIKLYSQVLDEIGQIELADREVVMLQDRYRRAIHRQMGTTAFVTAAHMATGSMDGMVRTGVNSWLDYRDMTFARELDAFKVEKTRMTAVVDKSSKFLDTFWKLGQSRNIPDSWLIRGNDLDELEEAVREPDLEKRMRVLRRMEGFMECYPPYWYFVARTEQGLGRLPQAGKTFEKVVDLAHGHFRRDDMLAAAMANRALILDVLKQPHADRVAKAALGYSNSVWEANLIAAQVLERHGRAHEAEDAILRNLDSDLEKSSSAVALLGLYFRQNRNRELAGLLASGELLKEIPVLSLVQCLQRLGSDTPPAVSQHLRESLRVAVEPRFGADDLLLIAEPGWSVELASVRLFLPGTVLDGPGVGAGQREVMKPSPAGLPGSSSLTTTGTSQAASSSPGTSASLGPSAFVRFSGAVDAGGPFSSSNPLLDGSVALIDFRGRLPETQPLVVVFGPALAAAGGNSATAPWWTAASPVELRYGARRFDLTGQGLAADPLAGRWPASSPTGLPSPPTAASPVVASPTAASLTAPAVPAPAQPRGSLLPGPEVVRLPSAAGPYAAAFLPSTPAPGAGPLRATILGIRGVSVASPAARQDAPPARRKPSTPSLLPFFPPGQVSPKWTEVEPSAPQTPSPPVD